MKKTFSTLLISLLSLTGCYSQVLKQFSFQNTTGVTGAVLDSPKTTVLKLTITPAGVGLDKVNNTSDANKPVSSATKAALDLKADKKLVDDLAAKVSAVKPTINTVNTVTVKVDSAFKDSIKVAITNKADKLSISDLQKSIAQLINITNSLAGDLAKKEDKIPYVYYGNTFTGTGKDSVNALESIIPQYTSTQIKALKDPKVILVYQVDGVSGLYVKEGTAWRKL